jgi:uncharacterized protein (DUF1697 family)
VTRYAALLRGINVGGHNPLRMPLLQDIAAGLGYAAPTTYLQSGNLAFTSRKSERRVAAELHDAIIERAAIDIPVIVRTHAELVAAVEANPLGEPENDALVFVTYCAHPVGDALDGLDRASYLPEWFGVVGREIYAWLPDGAHQARLTQALWERRTRGVATTRNWRTARALVDLTS